MRLAVFIKTAGNLAGLISAEKEGLIFASFFVTDVEVVNNRRGGGKNFRSFERGVGDGKLTVRTAGMESELDFRGFVVPIERIFHFIAIEIGVIVGVDGGGGDDEMVFAENFGDKFGLELVFVIPIDDLPRRSGEKTGVLGFNAKFGRVINFGGEGFVVAGFFLSDIKFEDFFAGKGIPEEDFAVVGMSGESLATRDNFLNNHREIITHL